MVAPSITATRTKAGTRTLLTASVIRMCQAEYVCLLVTFQNWLNTSELCIDERGKSGTLWPALQQSRVLFVLMSCVSSAMDLLKNSAR